MGEQAKQVCCCCHRCWEVANKPTDILTLKLATLCRIFSAVVDVVAASVFDLKIQPSALEPRINTQSFFFSFGLFEYVSAFAQLCEKHLYASLFIIFCKFYLFWRMCELSNLQFVCWANSQMCMRVAVCEYVHGARCSTRSSKIRFLLSLHLLLLLAPSKVSLSRSSSADADADASLLPDR